MAALVALALGGIVMVLMQVLGADAQTISILAGGLAAGLPAAIALGARLEDKARQKADQ